MNKHKKFKHQQKFIYNAAISVVAIASIATILILVPNNYPVIVQSVIHNLNFIIFIALLSCLYSVLLELNIFAILLIPLGVIAVLLDVLAVFTSKFIIRAFSRSRKKRTLMYLRIYFPEEVVAEFIALHTQLVNKKESIWLIRVKMIRQFLSLIWAFYFQIKIDNIRSRFDNERINK
jgi:hypothetical protein